VRPQGSKRSYKQEHSHLTKQQHRLLEPLSFLHGNHRKTDLNPRLENRTNYTLCKEDHLCKVKNCKDLRLDRVPADLQGFNQTTLLTKCRYHARKHANKLISRRAKPAWSQQLDARHHKTDLSILMVRTYSASLNRNLDQSLNRNLDQSLNRNLDQSLNRNLDQSLNRKLIITTMELLDRSLRCPDADTVQQYSIVFVPNRALFE
jgi:hypothetical protein